MRNARQRAQWGRTMFAHLVCTFECACWHPVCSDHSCTNVDNPPQNPKPTPLAPPTRANTVVQPRRLFVGRSGANYGRAKVSPVAFGPAFRNKSKTMSAHCCSAVEPQSALAWPVVSKYLGARGVVKYAPEHSKQTQHTINMHKDSRNRARRV